MGTQLMGIRLFRDNILNEDFWPKSNWTEEDTIRSIVDYDLMLGRTFFTDMFSTFEYTLRSLLDAIEPPKSKGQFVDIKQVCERLSKYMEGDSTIFLTLIDLLRTIRNVMHNNGIYLGKNDKYIQLGDKFYTFKVGEPVADRNWAMTLFASELITSHTAAFVRDKKISSYEHIKDPLTDWQGFPYTFP